MGHARYIGRVGALAVALGVGAAVASAPGAAWADDPGDSTAASPNTEGQQTTGAPAGPGTPSVDQANDPGSDGSAGQQQEADPADGDDGTAGSQTSVDLGDGVVVSSSGGSVQTGETEELEPQPSVEPETAAAQSSRPGSTASQGGSGADHVAEETATETTQSRIGSSDLAGATAADVATLRSTVPDEPPQQGEVFNPLIVSTAELPASQSVSEGTSTPATAHANVVTSMLAAFFTPFASFVPNAPLESPLLWVFAAAARREFGLTTQPAAGMTGEVNTGLMMVGEALVDQVVDGDGDPDAELGTADPTSGAISGVVVPPAGPEGKTPAYTLVSQPAEGTFAFNRRTGAFTYTPTTAQRVIAGLSPETDTVDFTVTVKYSSRGPSTPVTVSVPVSPTSLTDAGAIATGGGADAFAVTDIRAWVANTDEKTITVIDTINRTTIATIGLAEKPLSVSVTPDGRKVFVVDDTTHTITVIDGVTNTVLAPIDLGPNRYPTTATVSPDGKTLYAPGAVYDARADSWTTVVTKVSTATGKITGTVKVPGSSDVIYDLQFTPDGKKVYLISDLAIDDPEATPPSALYTFSSSGRTAKQIATGTYFIGMTISPDGKRVYVNDVDAGMISVLDTKTNEVVGSIPFSAQTLGGIALNDDGSVLLAVDTITNSVLAFDTTDNYAQIATVHTNAPTPGYYPGLSLSPDGMELYYGSDNGLQVVSLVPQNAKPVAAGVSIAPPNASGVVTGAVGVADDDEDRLTYTVTAAPGKGKVVVNPEGTFTYTPTAAAQHAASRVGAPDADKIDTFTVVVSDGRRGFASETITVDIKPANAAPTIKLSVPNPSSSGVVKGSVSAKDANKDVLSYSVSPTANGGAVTVDAKGRFVYTPTAEDRHAAATGAPGTTTDSFTVTVTDGYGGVVNVPVTVKIKPINAKPEGAKVSLSPPNETTGAVLGTVTATDADADDLTISGPVTTSKGVITYNGAEGTFTYTPTAEARAAAYAPRAKSSAKTDKFTVVVSDGHGGTDSVAVTVVINAVGNENPETGAANVNAPSGSKGAVTGTVTASDPDANTLSYSGSQTTSKGKVKVSANGAFTYTPTATARHAASVNGAGADLTQDTFDVEVSDGRGGFTTVPVTVVISPSNAAPSRIKASATKPDTTTGLVTGRVTSSDADKDVRSYSAPTTSAKGGSVQVNSDGTFSYTPSVAARQAAAAPGAPESAKLDSFAVTVDDGHVGGITVVNVQVTVAPASTVPGSVFNPAIVGSVGIGHGPNDIEVTPDGRYAYTANYGSSFSAHDGSVTVVDTVTKAAKSTITIGGTVYGVAAAPDGSTVYAVSANDTDDGGTVSIISTATNTVTGSIGLPAGNNPTAVTITPDGSTLIVASHDGTLQIIDTATRSVVKTLDVGGYGNQIAVSPDGTKVWVAHDDSYPQVSVVTLASGQVKTIAAGDYPSTQAVVVSNDNRYAFVLGDGVAVINAGTQNTYSTSIPGVYGSDLAISPDGKYLVVAQDDGAIAFIDTTAKTVVKTLTIGGSLDAVAVSADGKRLYVTDRTHQALTIVDVYSTNQAPTIRNVSVDAPDPATGVVTGSFTAADGDGDPITVTGAVSTVKGSAVINADGTFTYTPTDDARHAAAAVNGSAASKVDTFDIVVRDDHGAVTTMPVTVTISPTNQPIDATAFVRTPNSSTGVVTGKIINPNSVTSPDPDDDPLTFTGSTTTGKGSVVVNADGTFVYTPTDAARHNAAKQFAGPALTTDSFSITVNDGHGSIVTVPVTVQVSPKNAVPVLNYVVRQADPTTGIITGYVTATDADGDTLELGTGMNGFTAPSMPTSIYFPSKGWIEFRADGTFTYTPTTTARANAAAAGASEEDRTDSFLVGVDDGHLGRATVTITVPISPAVGDERISDTDILDRFDDPRAIVMGPDGRIYLAQVRYDPEQMAYDPSIEIVDPDGGYSRISIPVTHLGYISDLAVLSADRAFAVHNGKVVEIDLVNQTDTVVHSSEDELQADPFNHSLRFGRVVASDDTTVYVYERGGSILRKINLADETTADYTQFREIVDVAVDPNGRLYVAHDSGRISVLSQDGSVTPVIGAYAVDSDGGIMQIVTTNDGRAYVLWDGYNSNKYVTVVEAGETRGKLVWTGNATLVDGFAADGDGRVFLNSRTPGDDGQRVITVIDTARNTVSVSVNDSKATGAIQVGADGRIYGAYSYYERYQGEDGEETRTRGAITVFKALESWEEPEPPATIHTGSYSAGDLYAKLRDKTNNTDGIYMESLVDSQGNERLIVFIGGTTPNWIGPNQPIITNLDGYTHKVKDHQIDMIDAALGIQRTPLNDTTIADYTQIMLVGYSQGGMDAQNIAANAKALGYKNVTTVITFGAPAVQGPIDGVHMAFLWDHNDPVPNLSHLDDLAADADLLYYGYGGVYNPSDPLGINVHADPQTYQVIGRNFDKSTDPDFAGLIADMAKFKGTVTEYNG